MTVFTRRLVVLLTVAAGTLGVIFLAVSFLTKRVKIVTETGLTEQELAQLAASDAGQLTIADHSNGQAGSTFSVSTNLDSNASNVLPPLKKSNEFVAKTARELTLTTNQGKVVINLFASDAPNTITNLLTLADTGFYDGLKFHRVEPGFLVQIGDPASRDATTTAELLKLGAGDPGYRIADEISPNLSHNKAGIVAMANRNIDGSLPDSAGSQFYITLEPTIYLDGRYTIFGEVTQGLDVVQRLTVGDMVENVTYQ